MNDANLSNRIHAALKDVGWILLAAFILRCALALVHPFLFSDSKDYIALATRIAHGRSYRVRGLYANRMPGYAVFLAAVFFVAGVHVKIALCVQAVFGALTCLAVYLLGLRINRATGIAAAVLVAVDPLCVAFSAALLTEALFTTVFVFILGLTLWLLKAKRPWVEWLLLALGWAAAIYVRPSVTLCLPLLLGVMATVAWRVGALREKGPKIAAVAALVFASLLPWWFRNYELFHDNFFRLTTLEGKSLYESVYSGATGGPRQSTIARPRIMGGLNEGRRDAMWTRMAWRDMRANPSRILWLAGVKILRTWSPWLHPKRFQSPWINVPLSLWYLAVYALAVIGLFRGGGGRVFTAVMLTPILYFTLLHSLFLGSVRYRVPLMPIVEVFAGAGVAAMIGDARRRKAASSASTAGRTT